MRATGLLLAATLGLAVAETVDLFFPWADQQGLLALSLGSDATATTWLMGCPINSRLSGRQEPQLPSLPPGCGFPFAVTVTEGPKTMHLSAAVGDGNIRDFDCKLDGRTSAICTATISGPDATRTDLMVPTSTVDSTSGDLASLFITATVVTNSALIQLSELPTDSNTDLSSTTTRSSSGSAQTPAITSAPTLATSTKPGSTGAATTSSAAAVTTSSSAVATTPSKAGVPQITGSSRWVVGGMAALALAAL